MSKLAILTDSGCQLTERKGIYIAPLQMMIDGKNYKDIIDIDSKGFYDLMVKLNLPASTSCPTTGDLVEAVKRLKADGYDQVVAISMATGLSSTLNGMKIACEMEEVDYVLVDSMGTAGNQKYLVQLADYLIQEGKSADEIKAILDECVVTSDTLILVPNLEHLSRGGRITPAVAKLGTLLKIVPVMKLNHDLGGRIDTYGKTRTIKKANQSIIEYMKKVGVNNTDYVITVEHVLADDYKDMITEMLKDELDITKFTFKLLPACVGAHMGVGGIGYQFIKKYKGIDFE